jgi:PAS domain S-box-containing protein
LTVDNEWRITSFNPAAERITGHKAENVMGKQCYEVMKSETCKTNCPLRKTMASKMPIYDYEIEIINAQGKIVPISVNTALLIDEQDNIIGGIETFRDLSIFKKLAEELHEKYSYEKIIGKDKKMQEVYGLLETISPINTTVLITGETGTGKELVARAIHHNSPRKHKPFVKIDCSAIPETLIESELFGYMKGAFTDARADKPGKFQLADKGTIFLDEIGNIPLSVQAKLLRIIEEQTFEPLGGVKTIGVDVRIIAATNLDLQKSIAQGTFRQDLYYRINVLTVTLPPLRARSGDIPQLVNHFITVFNEKFGKAISRLSQDAMDVLIDYPWPGNVRQLEHAIEHAFIHCTGRTIQTRHLPEDIKQKSSPLIDKLLTKENPIDEIEKEVIIEALKRNHWDREKTAKILKISRITLWRKMRKYEIKHQ